MFRLLITVILVWALMSSDLTTADFEHVVKWASAHLHLSVR
jgi:hypothetical protein